MIEEDKIEGEKQESPEPVEASAQSVAASEAQEASVLPKTNVEDAKNSLHVKLEIYDGPLDLLLELIKKNEMDVYNIPVAEVTQQYLEWLALQRQLDLEVAGEFLVMAATLLYIKSKLLLPQAEEEEEDEEGDPRDELVRKLVEYQAFKEAAKELGFREDERGQTFTRQISDYYMSKIDESDVEIDAFSADLYDLLSAFRNVVQKMGRVEMHEVYEESITIEEKTVEIKMQLIDLGRVQFSKLFRVKVTRNELIATFLAILEIVKSRFARVKQDDHYGEIYIEKLEEEHLSSEQPIAQQEEPIVKTDQQQSELEGGNTENESQG